MNKIMMLLLLLFLGGFAQAQEIEWMRMNDALEAQKENPKKIFMDAYTSWCGPCKMLDKNTFSNKDVVDYINENFYPVKFNAEGNEEVEYRDHVFKNPQYDPDRSKGRNSPHQLASALKITGYPSLVFFAEDGSLITPVMGYKTPGQLEIYLRMFAEDDYKELTSREAWTEYAENFEGSFED